MATQKPISTISYNSEPFLVEKLQELYSAHIIQAYCYIKHKGEDGDKDHIHLRIEPNKKLDPMELTDMLKEYVKGQDKPLGVRPWRPSKEEDWTLYVLHDHDYLNLKYGGGDKGEKLPYSWTDLKASEMYDVEVAYIRAKQYLEHTAPNVVKRLTEGARPLDLVSEGVNVFTVRAISQCVRDDGYYKLSRENLQLQSELDSAYVKISDMVQALADHGLEFYYDSEHECKPILRRIDHE